ncbi:O-antigen ligase family protein [Bacillus weihaiensis]|uniref:O-antigen ligase-related domain-containing protein n=1 Tax=Bacillus weihaiensis TaxID=1547283 RepID=A0A1L3MMH4_9BACI|nr:O-antigen ligase family protein [Bacillus weihaiensis]APH03560.1 hypothetical protein A9C19_01655 [Bacillus weihaiensis]
MPNRLINKRYQIPLFIFILGLLMLKPAPGVLFGAISVKLIPLIILFISFIILTMFVKVNIKSLLTTVWKSDYIFLFLLLSILSLIISTISGIIQKPEYTSIADLIELYRYGFYISFYLIAKNVKIENISSFIKPFFIFIVIIELFGVLQFFNIFNINYHIGLLYTSSESLMKMIVNQHRITSTFQNPNMYGSFLIIAVAFILSYITFMVKRNKIWSYALLTLSLLSVFFTTSRTAVICTLGVIVYWILLQIITRQVRILTVITNGFLTIAIFAALALFLIPQIPYLDYAADQMITNFETDEEPDVEENNTGNEEEDITKETKNSNTDKIKKSVESVSSFKSRYYYWEQNLTIFKESPVFGLGPMKDGFVRFADNSYLYTLARYGIVGLLIMAGLYLYLFVRTFSQISRENTGKKVLGMTLNLTLVGYAVMGMVAEVWYNLQSITILFVIIGLLYNANLKGEEKQT